MQSCNSVRMSLGESSAFCSIISPPPCFSHLGSLLATLTWWRTTGPTLPLGLASSLPMQSLTLVVQGCSLGALSRVLVSYKEYLKESYPTSFGMSIMARNGDMPCDHRCRSPTECPPPVHSLWEPLNEGSESPQPTETGVKEILLWADA